MVDRVQGVVTQQGNDVSDLINRYAEAEGCDAVGLLAGLISESELDERAERIGTWPDWSEGLGQQTLLYASVGDHTASAENLRVCRAYYWQPENAIQEAARQYGAYYRHYGSYVEAWSRYNGGGAMAFADNPNRANIQRGWDAAQAYVAPGDAVYDPDAAPERQVQPWTCSVRTATWLLNSLGFARAAGDVQDAMVAAGLVTPADGLEDGTGEALEGWLHGQTGLPVLGQRAVTWDELQALAGQAPIGMGSGTLYHWLAVRRVLDADTLALMNPAPGYRDLGDTMSRAQFDQWAPWNAIWLVPPAPVEEDDPVVIAYLAKVATEDVLPNIDSALAHIATVLATPRVPKAARKELETARDNLAAGAKPAAETISRGGADA
jgi:hypothetical protein